MFFEPDPGGPLGLPDVRVGRGVMTSDVIYTSAGFWVKSQTTYAWSRSVLQIETSLIVSTNLLQSKFKMTIILILGAMNNLFDKSQLVVP